MLKQLFQNLCCVVVVIVDRSRQASFYGTKTVEDPEEAKALMDFLATEGDDGDAGGQPSGLLQLEDQQDADDASTVTGKKKRKREKTSEEEAQATLLHCMSSSEKLLVDAHKVIDCLGKNRLEKARVNQLKKEVKAVERLQCQCKTFLKDLGSKRIGAFTQKFEKAKTLLKDSCKVANGIKEL